MEKTYSQKVARVFEVIDYFLLFPAAIGALVSVFALMAGSAYALLTLAVLTVGIILMVGYFKHSRGRLDEKYFSALWLTSAGFNFLLFLPWLYYASVILQTNGFKADEGQTDGGAVVGFIFLLGAVFAYLAAIISSVKAYTFEKRKKYL
jgi:hypothetical protein